MINPIIKPLKMAMKFPRKAQFSSAFGIFLWHNAHTMTTTPLPPPKNAFTPPAKPAARSRFWLLGLSALCLCGAVVFTGLNIDEAIAAKPGSGTTVTVSEFRTIEFGTIAGSADGPGTVVLSPTGAITTTGYGIIVKGTVRAGEYKIVGPANANVLITLPSTATISNGTSSATLSNFTSSPANTATLSSQGKLTISVGATLTLPAGQAEGDYTGTFPIFVDLQ